jgi:hypothetical protein
VGDYSTEIGSTSFDRTLPLLDWNPDASVLGLTVSSGRDTLNSTISNDYHAIYPSLSDLNTSHLQTTLELIRLQIIRLDDLSVSQGSAMRLPSRSLRKLEQYLYSVLDSPALEWEVIREWAGVAATAGDSESREEILR